MSCLRFWHIFSHSFGLDGGYNSIEDKVQETEKLPNLWTAIIAFYKQKDSKCLGTTRSHTQPHRHTWNSSERRVNKVHIYTHTHTRTQNATLRLKYDKHAEAATFITMAHKYFSRLSFSGRGDDRCCLQMLRQCQTTGILLSAEAQYCSLVHA